MLRHFSPQSRQIIDEAQDIARQYKQEYVDGEHVLLAMVEKDHGRASKVLRQAGVTPGKLRQSIEPFFRQPSGSAGTVTGRLPGTLHVRNVVAHAVEIAEQHKAPAVEPEHLLLAISREADSLAVQALNGFGLDSSRIERMLGEG